MSEPLTHRDHVHPRSEQPARAAMTQVVERRHGDPRLGGEPPEDVRRYIGRIYARHERAALSDLLIELERSEWARQWFIERLAQAPELQHVWVAGGSSGELGLRVTESEHRNTVPVELMKMPPPAVPAVFSITDEESYKTTWLRPELKIPPPSTEASFRTIDAESFRVSVPVEKIPPPSIRAVLPLTTELPFRVTSSEVKIPPPLRAVLKRTEEESSKLTIAPIEKMPPARALLL